MAKSASERKRAERERVAKGERIERLLLREGEIALALDANDLADALIGAGAITEAETADLGLLHLKLVEFVRRLKKNSHA